MLNYAYIRKKPWDYHDILVVSSASVHSDIQALDHLPTPLQLAGKEKGQL